MTPISDERLADAEWLEQAARYFEKRDTGGEDMAFWANVANAERCQSIAQSLRAQGGVRVKPLEWSQGWGERRAATPFGEYRLSTNTTGHFDWHSPNGERHWASTEDTAKAAAQADYERRILSSLEASPAPVSEEIEADRARLIHILVVHFHLFRDKAEEAADLFLHHKTLAAKGGQ